MELSSSTSQSITIRTLSFSDKNEVMRISKGIYFGKFLRFQKKRLKKVEHS